MPEIKDTVQAFELAQLLARRRNSNKPYFEFLRVPSLSLGIYELPARSVDPQEPHAEDEIYYVVSGRASIRVGPEERTVMPGLAVFVAAGVEHRFFDIQEDLTLLVFFAPAESQPASAS